MVKSEIIKQLHKKHPALKRNHIEAIFDIMFNSISKSLIEEKSVELTSFGGRQELSGLNGLTNGSIRDAKVKERAFAKARKKKFLGI